MADVDRQYFRRRALQEIECATRAGPIEAKIAHARLAGLHLRRCAGYTTHKTDECLGCPLAYICDYPHKVAIGRKRIERLAATMNKSGQHFG